MKINPGFTSKKQHSARSLFFTSILDIDFSKKLVPWSRALFGAETWTFWTIQKFLESFEMWGWKRMEKISWTVHVNNKKLEKFTQILGILNNNFRPSMFQKFSIIKVCNALAVPILLHGSKIWTHQRKGEKRLRAIEMKIFRETGYTLFDDKRNDKILLELKAEPADVKLRRYKSNWLRHVTRMDNNRMPKIMLNYRPNGQTKLGRTLKRLLDKAARGLSRPHSLWIMMMTMMMMIIIIIM